MFIVFCKLWQNKKRDATLTKNVTFDFHLQELGLKEDMMRKMENSLENYKRKFAVMRHQQGLLYSDYLKDKKVRRERDSQMKTSHVQI